MNRREMLKTVVGGAVAACVGATVVATQSYHVGVDLACEAMTTFAIGSEGLAPLVITHGADGRWRASRDGIEWRIERGITAWLHLRGSNGDCKMLVRGDNIIDIEWLRFWDSPDKVLEPAPEQHGPVWRYPDGSVKLDADFRDVIQEMADKYDMPELMEIVV